MPNKFCEWRRTFIKSNPSYCKKFGAAVIGLTMDDDGITHDPNLRFQIAEKILERTLKLVIKEEDEPEVIETVKLD